MQFWLLLPRGSQLSVLIIKTEYSVDSWIPNRGENRGEISASIIGEMDSE